MHWTAVTTLNLHPLKSGNVPVEKRTKITQWTQPKNGALFLPSGQRIIIVGWAMSGEFGRVQKWLVGATAECLLYRNTR